MAKKRSNKRKQGHQGVQRVQSPSKLRILPDPQEGREQEPVDGEFEEAEASLEEVGVIQEEPEMPEAEELVPEMPEELEAPEYDEAVPEEFGEEEASVREGCDLEESGEEEASVREGYDLEEEAFDGEDFAPEVPEEFETPESEVSVPEEPGEQDSSDEDEFAPESITEFEAFEEEGGQELEMPEEPEAPVEFEALDDEEIPVPAEEPAEAQEPSSEVEFAELETSEESDASYWDDAAAPSGNGEDAGGFRNGINPVRMLVAVRFGIFLLIFAGVIYLLLPYYCVKPELTIEAGENCPPVLEFLKWKNKKAVYVAEINENTVLDRVGDYGVMIKIYGRKIPAVLHVVDTVAPNVKTRKVSIFGGDKVETADFVESVEDVTPVMVRFAKEPDCVTEGINTVLLEVEDEGGNITKTEAFLEVIYDTEPPVIHGVRELTMTEGASISYKKGITVTDNYDRDVKLNVDTSQVDTGRAGDYTVTYTATDSRGNQALVPTILHVLPLTIETVTEENINAEADKILASIFTEGMSKYEKARAIYDWCHERIAYSNNDTHMPDWIQEAYKGLINRKGDCYVYAATAKCLLTRAGIDNLDIERIPAGNSRHQWNLIDIGEGWHHFDTCRRYDGSTFFYKTDAEIAVYSNAHNGTHNYDRSLYPEIE